jgi:ribosomal protein S18 acetylase RimI-like enzyme
MFRIVLFSNLVVLSCYAAEGLQILKANDLIDNPQLELNLKAVYFKSFSEVYRSHWSMEFEEVVLEGFTTYIERFKQSNDMALVVATMDNVLAGWILFYKEQERAIVELICISPEHQRKGLGKKLIFSIRECWPEVTNLAVVTRRINVISPLFYESLGFRKTNFMLPEYSPADVQGYELNL